MKNRPYNNAAYNEKATFVLHQQQNRIESLHIVSFYSVVLLISVVHSTNIFIARTSKITVPVVVIEIGFKTRVVSRELKASRTHHVLFCSIFFKRMFSLKINGSYNQTKYSKRYKKCLYLLIRVIFWIPADHCAIKLKKYNMDC